MQSLTTILQVSMLVLLLLLLAVVMWLGLRRSGGNSEFIHRLEQSQLETARLQGEIEALRKQMESSLSSVTKQVGVFGEVKTSLGELTKATQQVYEVGKDVAGLHEILRAPKLRGGLGELMLGDLLAKILPAEHYMLQHPFSGGETVDAAIHLANGIVPVDSKFPLENFRQVLQAESDDERAKARRSFDRDVRKHVDAIADKYIRPDEGTFDFAMMYIPAENVYYEIVVQDESDSGRETLVEYALGRRVVPVSPNSFYAYLNVIVLGLRGLRIEQQAKAILGHLSALRTDFEKASRDFETLGKHLDNAQKKYSEANRKFERFGDRLADASSVAEVAEAAPAPGLLEPDL